MDVTPRGVARPQAPVSGGMLTVMMLGLLFAGWAGEWPIEYDSVMYHGLWRSPMVVFGPLFIPVPGIRLCAWQILLIGLLPFCGTSVAGRRHAPELDRALLVSIVCIVVTTVWGALRGGSVYFAYYQVWRLLAAFLIAYIMMSALRSERDLISLGKIVVVAALIRAVLCIYFFTTPIYDSIRASTNYVTNHDDSMLFVVAILILAIWACLNIGKKAVLTAMLIVPVLLTAMVLNNRRIAWVELGWTMMLVYILIGPGAARKRINRWLLIVAPLAIIYIIAGMNSDNPVFAPVHALATTGSNADSSSLTRKEEIRNLLRTLVDHGNPLFGTGWGVPYTKVESVYSNYDPRWILYLYTPHSSIIGLAAFSGLVGILGIWGVVPLGAFLAARGYKGSTEAVPRTAAMVALCSLVVYSAHCYGDIGLQSFAGALILGGALGTAGKIATWCEALPATEGTLVRRGGRRPKAEPRFEHPKASARANRPASAGRTPTRRPSR